MSTLPNIKIVCETNRATLPILPTLPNVTETLSLHRLAGDRDECGFLADQALSVSGGFRAIAEQGIARAHCIGITGTEGGLFASEAEDRDTSTVARDDTKMRSSSSFVAVKNRRYAIPD